MSHPLFRSTLLASGAVLIVIAVPAAAQTAPVQTAPVQTAPAQTTPAQTAAADAAADDELVVTGYRGALRTVLENKKLSDRIVESVSAEDIGKLPDNSIAESKRGSRRPAS